MPNCLLRIMAFILLLASPCLAGGLKLFPKDKLQDLTLVETDQARGEFVVMNRNQETRQGALGDLIGMETARVVSVANNQLVVELRERVKKADGSVRDQVTQLVIPRAQALSHPAGGGKGVQ